MPEPLGIYSALRDYYVRYYETPFSVRDTSVQQERRQLLMQDGVISREPWLEPLVPYASTGRDIAESCALAGVSSDLADFVTLEQGLVPAGRPLYVHQEQALKASCQEHKHVVITAGTGSGKTESFLLPLFANLLSESERWQPNNRSSSAWWDSEDEPFTEQRAGETGRLPGIRARVLYPMNALVDDQLQRLRRGLDSPSARGWLDHNRRGHRFYFARYTSRTPVAGPRDKRRLRRLRRALNTMGQRATIVANDPLRRYFMPQLDGAEMRSRWDMQAHAPDILITNYSMLDVMLLRKLEDPIFDQTRNWLEADEQNVFTIIVDELHMYRGTAGTEIAFLLRNLLLRLGIADKPDRVRFLAASASVGGAPDEFLRFLEGFFAQPRHRFAVLKGEVSLPPPDRQSMKKASPALALAGKALADGRDEAAEAALQRACKDAGKPSSATGTQLCGDLTAAVTADACLLDACWDDHQETVCAQSASDLAAELFDLPAEQSGIALQALLHTMEQSHDHRPGARTVRAHYFFRNVQGVWACSNPRCPEALRLPEQERREPRTVGRLFLNPQIQCKCGSRVLELLYCQNCGELFLGGWRTHDPDKPNAWYLVGDLPNLEQLPDAGIGERTADRYALYWPRPGAAPAVKPWTAENGTFTFSFKQARYDPTLGHLEGHQFDPTGWLFDVHAPDDRPPPALPTRCPRCADDWETGKTTRAPEDPGRAKSPVRFMRTGFEKVTQVLSDALLRQISDTPAHRKLVAFTDSRQDAAKLGAGLEKRHYEDTVRQLLASHTTQGSGDADDLAAFELFIAGDRAPETTAGYERFTAQYPYEAAATMAMQLGGATESQRERVHTLRSRLTSRTVSLPAVRDTAERQLLSMGMNPAGPDLSRQTLRGEKGRWTQLFDFSGSPPRGKSPGDLTEPQRDWLAGLRHDLLNESMRLIFAELYTEVVDDPENEGGVPSRLIKTEPAPKGGERKARRWWMFARSRSRSPARRSRSRSTTSRVRELVG